MSLRLVRAVKTLGICLLLWACGDSQPTQDTGSAGGASSSQGGSFVAGADSVVMSGRGGVQSMGEGGSAVSDSGSVAAGGVAVQPPVVADNDPPSLGGTITFENIGAPGWYPSRRDPASGNCDAYQNGQCCLARHEVTTDTLSPWDTELILTLRGPLVMKQFAVYQPEAADAAQWNLTSVWDDRDTASARGIAMSGDNNAASGFEGVVGSTCIVDVASGTPFECGSGSEPYCEGEPKHLGWAGSKLFVMLASMPHVGAPEVDAAACSNDPGNNWYDAPWIGLSLGELIRAGKFGSCHCYAKSPDEWYLADGCGQFNVFEVVNDNNTYQNLDLFSTNFFAYHGYVGEGPCGQNCNLDNLEADVDLVDKSSSTGATMGGLASPNGGPGVAFVRPDQGFRYFLMLLDVQTRTVQLAVLHPDALPTELMTLLPALPGSVGRSSIDALLALRRPG